RLSGRVRSAVPEGAVRVADRSRAAAQDARDRQAADAVHRHVDARPDRRGDRRGRAGAIARGACDLDLSLRAARAESARHQHAAGSVSRRAHRLFRPRDRARDHVRGRHAGGGVHRAARHARPQPLGLRPGRLGGDRRSRAARARHPRHRGIAGRRRQGRLSERAGGAEALAPRAVPPCGLAGRDRRRLAMHGVELWTLVAVAAAGVLFAALERRFPYNPGQGLLRTGFWTDFVLYCLVQSYFMGVVIGRLLQALDARTGASHLGLIAGWPVAAQLAFFIVTHDIYIYFFHRWQHRSPLLWRLHPAHHSLPEVDWLSGVRSHSLEILINQTIEFAPIVLLGASPEVAVLKGAVSAIWGMFIHANLDVDLGWLRYIINGPRMHRWHHAD